LDLAHVLDHLGRYPHRGQKPPHRRHGGPAPTAL